MNRRRALFLVLALVIGLGTLMMMRATLGHKSGAQEVAQSTEVLVAASDIGVGQFIQPNHIRWQSWAPEHVTEAFIMKQHGDTATAPATTKDASVTPENNDAQKVDLREAFIGAVARQNIKSGEPILKNAVVKPHDRGFLAAVLDPGRRAVAVPITNVTGIAGFAFPGDHVDLILTNAIHPTDDNKVSERRASMTIVKDVRVLALDQDAGAARENAATSGAKPEAKEAKVVTLEVTPKQAEIVTLGIQLGTLSLSLRSLSDDQTPQQAQGNGTHLTYPVAYQKSAYTLDSEVSEIIPRPEDHTDLGGQVVQVLRGSSERKAESFDKTGATTKN